MPLFVAVLPVVAIFAGPEPAGLAGPVSRFPEIRGARTVENGLYLAVPALWAPLTLALGHRLRQARPASALFASGLNMLSLAVLAAGRSPTRSPPGSPISPRRGRDPRGAGNARACCGRRIRARSTPGC